MLQSPNSVKLLQRSGTRHQEDFTLQLTSLEDSGRDYVATILDSKKSVYTTGMKSLDDSMRGVDRGEMCVVAARPSMGKTMFLLQWATHLASEGIKCAFISEEMTPRQLGKRALHSSTDIHHDKWRNRYRQVLADHDAYWEKKVKVIMPSKPVRTVSNACLCIELLREQHKVEVVFLDYLQLLRSPGNSRYEEVTAISIALKNAAVEHDIALIVAAQLNRELDKREGTPRYSDLRDSGQIEQDTDVCLFLDWPVRRNPAHKPPMEYLVYVGKNRNRGTGASPVKLRIDADRQTIREEVAEEMPNRKSEFDVWNNSPTWE